MRILAQDRLLELSQRQAGLDPELLDEQAPGVSVDLQRLCLAAGAVERAHQLATQLLTEWMRGHERLELSDEIGVPAEPQLELDPLADHREPEILEPCDLRPSEVLEGKLLQRRTSPESERLAQQFDRAFRVVMRSRLGDERVEAVAIELPGFDAEQIARRPREDHSVVGARLARLEQSPQVRYVRLDHVGCRLGALLAPDVVDQASARDDLVRVQQQAQEERALFGGSQVNDAA